MALSGCAGLLQGLAENQASDPPPTYGHRFRLTAVSAAIQSTQPNGEAWHRQKPDKTVPILSGLAALTYGRAAGQLVSTLLGDPEVGGAVAPTTQLEIRVGGTFFQTFPFTTSLSPRWDYAFAVDVRDYEPDTTVVLIVRDVDGGGVLGEERTTLAKLLERQDVNLTALGSVDSLQLKIDALPDLPGRQVFKFTVPTNRSVRDLARNWPDQPRFEGDWQRVPVLNGDVLRVRASGTVCPSTWSSDCSDAGGFPGRWQEYSMPEFRDLPHASLVGMYAGQPIFIGNGATFRIDKPGTLVLGVNDNDVGNNTGQFEVVVEVNPRDLVKARESDQRYRPPAWQNSVSDSPGPSPQPESGPGNEPPSSQEKPSLNPDTPTSNP